MAIGLKQKRLVGDAIRLASGTALAQLLGILATPIITRLYGPVAFGVSALFASVTTVLVTVSCLRYELAIPLAPSDEEGAGLLMLSVGSALFTTLVSAPLLLVFGRPVFLLLRAPEVIRYVWLMPAAILVGGIYLALTYWMTRRRGFGDLARARVARTATAIGSQVAAGYSGYVTGGSLIAATVMGSAAASILLGVRGCQKGGIGLFKGIKWQTLRGYAKRYRKFPIYSTWSALLNNVSWQLPTLLLSLFFSTKVVGYYALSASLLGLPMNLIGTSVAQVFYQGAATARSTDELRNVVEGVFQQLVRLATFPLLLLAFVGKDLFQVALGPQWAEAGVYSQILSVWIFFWFISSPLSTLPSILERQEFDLKLNIALVTTRLAALVIGGYAGSPRLAIALFSAFGVLVYGSLSVLILRMAKVRLADIARTMLTQFATLLPVGLALLGLDLLGVPEWARLATAAVSLAAFAWRTVRSLPPGGSIRARLGLA